MGGMEKEALRMKTLNFERQEVAPQTINTIFACNDDNAALEMTVQNYIFFVIFLELTIFAQIFMNIEFIDEDLKEFCSTGQSKKNRYKRYVRDKAFMAALANVLSTLLLASETTALKEFSFLHYEKLTGDRSGTSSVRIMNGRVERLIFRENAEGIEIVVMELNADHYGNKK